MATTNLLCGATLRTYRSASITVVTPVSSRLRLHTSPANITVVISSIRCPWEQVGEKWIERLQYFYITHLIFEQECIVYHVPEACYDEHLLSMNGNNWMYSMLHTDRRTVGDLWHLFSLCNLRTSRQAHYAHELNYVCNYSIQWDNVMT